MGVICTTAENSELLKKIKLKAVPTESVCLIILRTMSRIILWKGYT